MRTRPGRDASGQKRNPKRRRRLLLLFPGLLAALALRGPSPGPAGVPDKESGDRRLPLAGAALRTSSGRLLRADVVASGLDTPWDLAWGPDGALWFTERPGRVSRLDLATRRVTRVADIAVVESGESGLLGMAFHPDFPSQPYVYFAHSYRGLTGIRNRLIRMTWRSGRLEDPKTLLEGINGGGIHNGSRLTVGPDRMLYMTTGDAGNGDHAQDKQSLNGKILRLTLDGRSPPDNPFGSAVWTWGHRNPQGIAFRPGTAELYETEHGPSDADEVNRIEKGRNYGWPEVHGACDRADEVEFCRTHEVMEPITEYTPTIGISGLAFYDNTVVSGWQGSMLYTSLVGRKLIRLVLTGDGRHAASQEIVINGQYGRLRDVLVAPDGAVYIATSNKDGRGTPAPGDDRIIRITP